LRQGPISTGQPDQRQEMKYIPHDWGNIFLAIPSSKIGYELSVFYRIKIID
jgi:hypothetical protein